MIRILPLAIVLIMTVITIALSHQRAAAEADKPTGPVPVICVQPAELFEGKSTEQWRSEGPEGLAKLIKAMRPSIKIYIKSMAHPDTATSPERKVELAEARANILFIDQVAQQRDAYVSGLYWHTDLDAAIEEAKRTGRPILSLRMLGKLVDEYSCANSRFFRTTLYADRDLGKFLREKVVLHWKSVRPVPVITIDMGDGRTIKRTITGNSAHYVLDPNGRVVDCLPGLYGAGTFKRLGNEAHSFAEGLADSDDQAFAKALVTWHGIRAANLDFVWSKIADSKPPSERMRALKDLSNLQSLDKEVAARVASQRSPAKHAVESRLLNAALPDDLPSPQDAADDADLWRRVAAHYAKEAELGPMSKAMMRRKTISAQDAAKRSHMKGRVEDPLVAMVRNFENAIALDTARNEHLLHRELHNWFIEAGKPIDLDKLNRRVYAELFLTPDTDPWLGLVPADTYSALDGGGLSN